MLLNLENFFFALGYVSYEPVFEKGEGGLGERKGDTMYVHLHSAEGLEFVTCKNWREKVAGFRFVKVWAIAEPHLGQFFF